MLVLGSHGVGKTKLLLSLAGISGANTEHLEMNIRGDFLSRVVPRAADQTPVKLELWHTAGQEKFGHRALPAAFYRRARAAVIVYDVANRQSFLEVVEWSKQLRERAQQQQTDSPFTLILVGNRQTVDAEEEVSTYEGYSLASWIGASTFVECCAETGDGVDECVDNLVAGVTTETELKHTMPAKILGVEEVVAKSQATRVRSNSAFANAFRKTLTSEDQSVFTRAA